MNEFLMQLLKELEKNLHRSNVRSVGMGYLSKFGQKND